MASSLHHPRAESGFRDTFAHPNYSFQHSPFRKPKQVPSMTKPFHGDTALSMKTVLFPKLYIHAIRGPWHEICIQLSGGIHRSCDPQRSGTPLGSHEQDQSPGVFTPGLKLHPLILHPPRPVNLEKPDVSIDQLWSRERVEPKSEGNLLSKQPSQLQGNSNLLLR